MSWESDRMWDEMQDWADHGKYCRKHRQWYMDDSPCVGCEDGDPPWQEVRTQTPQRSHTTQPTHPSEPQATCGVESHPHPSLAAQPNNGSDDH